MGGSTVVLVVTGLPASAYQIRTAAAAWSMVDHGQVVAQSFAAGIGPRPGPDRWDEARRVADRLRVDMAGCRCPTPAAVWDPEHTVLGVVHEGLCPRHQ